MRDIYALILVALGLGALGVVMACINAPAKWLAQQVRAIKFLSWDLPRFWRDDSDPVPYRTPIVLAEPSLLPTPGPDISEAAAKQKFQQVTHRHGLDGIALSDISIEPADDGTYDCLVRGNRDIVLVYGVFTPGPSGGGANLIHCQLPNGEIIPPQDLNRLKGGTLETRS